METTSYVMNIAYAIEDKHIEDGKETLILDDAKDYLRRRQDFCLGRIFTNGIC